MRTTFSEVSLRRPDRSNGKISLKKLTSITAILGDRGSNAERDGSTSSVLISSVMRGPGLRNSSS